MRSIATRATYGFTHPDECLALAHKRYPLNNVYNISVATNCWTCSVDFILWFAQIHFVIADSMKCTMLPHVALLANNVSLIESRLCKKLTASSSLTINNNSLDHRACHHEIRDQHTTALIQGFHGSISLPLLNAVALKRSGSPQFTHNNVKMIISQILKTRFQHPSQDSVFG